MTGRKRPTHANVRIQSPLPPEPSRVKIPKPKSPQAFSASLSKSSKTHDTDQGFVDAQSPSDATIAY